MITPSQSTPSHPPVTTGASKQLTAGQRPVGEPSPIPLWERVIFVTSLALLGACMVGGVIFAWRREGHALPSLSQDPIGDAERHRAQNEALMAEEQYRLAAKLSRSDAIYYRRAGQAAQMIGDAKKAKSAFEHALLLDGNDAEAYYGLGSLALDAQDATGAFVFNGKAVQLKPDHAQAICNMGWALLMMDRRAEAAGAFGRALEVDPNLEPARSGLQQATGGAKP